MTGRGERKERGGYPCGDRTAAELPPPPPSIVSGSSGPRSYSRHEADLLHAEYATTLAQAGDQTGPAARDIAATLDKLAALHGGTLDATDLATALACIYCPGRLRRKYRI